MSSSATADDAQMRVEDQDDLEYAKLQEKYDEIFEAARKICKKIGHRYDEKDKRSKNRYHLFPRLNEVDKERLKDEKLEEEWEGLKTSWNEIKRSVRLLREKKNREDVKLSTAIECELISSSRCLLQRAVAYCTSR